jgi:hypothetical protein
MLRSFMKCSEPVRHQCNAKNVSLRPGTRQTPRCYNLNASREVTRAGAASFLITARSAVGEWLSLVEHLVRDQGVGGSNPLSPTIYFKRLQRLDPRVLWVQWVQVGRLS